MRLEETAVVIFGLTVIGVIGGFFTLAYWDALVSPAIEVTGAAVIAARYPVVFAVALVALAAAARRWR